MWHNKEETGKNSAKWIEIKREGLVVTEGRISIVSQLTIEVSLA